MNKTKTLFISATVILCTSCDVATDKLKEEANKMVNKEIGKIDSTINKEIKKNVSAIDTLINHQKK